MRNQEILKVGIYGIIINILLLIIKIIIGFLFHSYAIIADSLNSLSDIFSSIVTSIGAKLSSKPADESHDFGHEKAEYIASLLIGIFMIVAGFNMVYESILGIINNKSFEFSYILFIVPIVIILFKLLFYLYINKVNKKYDSLLLKANSNDQINDVYIAIGILISIICGIFGIYFVDYIISIIISTIIFITGINIFIKSYQVLIDKSIDFSLNSDIQSKVTDINGVYSIDSIKSKPTGYKHFIAIEITVDKNMTVETSHNIAHKVKDIINENDRIYDTIVHINPSR